MHEDQPRSYSGERAAAGDTDRQRVKSLLDQRGRSWPDDEGRPRFYGQTLLPLMLAAVPVTRVPYQQIVRTVVLPGQFALSITLTQTLPQAILPYGNDSHVLNYLITHADQAGFVPLATAGQYLAWSGQTDCGVNRDDLGQRLGRLLGLHLRVQTPAENAIDAAAQCDVIRQWRLPPSIRTPSSHYGAELTQAQPPFGIWLNPDLLVRKYHTRVPFPIGLMRELRRDPMALRLITLLSWASFALDRRTDPTAPSERLLPWVTLGAALGSQAELEWTPPTRRLARTSKPRPTSAAIGAGNATSFRSFRRQVVAALNMATAIWHELDARVAKDGILLRPPRDGQHLLTDASSYAIRTGPSAAEVPPDPQARQQPLFR